MNINEIETLVELVAASEIREIVLRNQDRKLTIRKPSKQVLPSPKPSAGRKQKAIATAGPAGNTKSVAVEQEPRILSPMVGLFRHAEPPVGVGTTIKQGSIVGVIESMKLMNDVRSEYDGVVTEILVESGMPVEYGSPLFAVDNA